MLKTKNTSSKSNVTKLVITAMLSAIAVVLQYLQFGVPFVPSFLKMDFSDIPELIGAFTIGPAGGVLICLIKNLIHMLVSQSGFVGELSNFIIGAAFAFTAGVLYKRHKTKKGALVACIAGTFAMALISVPSNYFVIYPIYAKLFGGMDAIIGLYQAIIPAADTLLKALLIVNVPFTFVKGILCVIVTMMIYKPISRNFTRMNEAINKKR